MNTKQFDMRTFLINSINKLFRENTSNNFYLTITKAIRDSLGTADENQFWQFAKVHTFTQSLAVSIDRLIYMNVSDVELTKEMLQLLAYANPNQATKLYGARVYVELQDETGSIIHPDGGKSLKALHPSGRTRMSWESLWQAFQDYTVGNLILDSELEAFKEANGYNVDPEI